MHIFLSTQELRIANMASPIFSVTLSYQGQSVDIDNVTTSTTGQELYNQTREKFSLPETAEIKLLLKGRKVNQGEMQIFSTLPKKKRPKILVMASSSAAISKISNQRSDPLIRGFDQEKQRQQAAQQQQRGHWGKHSKQDKNYRFVKLEACTWQSFGHRPSEKTPHAFAAKRLLEKLATDPGVVAIMKERELVVNTLGEMDPIDDRLMQKKEESGACLLGYNTNRGLRIDIRLRTGDLEGFMPYPQLAATLIHELSHNWVGEHDLLFWTNFAQMRAEYFYWHCNHATELVEGKTTAELAGFRNLNKSNIFQLIMQELVGDMRQHGLHPNAIQEPIKQRCGELEEAYSKVGQRLGSGNTTSLASNENLSARERALQAAERRRNQSNESKE